MDRTLVEYHEFLELDVTHGTRGVQVELRTREAPAQ